MDTCHCIAPHVKPVLGGFSCTECSLPFDEKLWKVDPRVPKLSDESMTLIGKAVDWRQKNRRRVLS